MSQIARNLTDGEDGFLLRRRYLIHDRDPLFTKAFRSIKSECLTQVIPIGEAHLRRAVREYVEHYHGAPLRHRGNCLTWVGISSRSSSTAPLAELHRRDDMRAVECAACLVVEISDGRIRRIEEYMDGAALAPLLG
jgi:hypothetical protein